MKIKIVILTCLFISSCCINRKPAVDIGEDRIRIASISELEEINKAWIKKEIHSYRVEYTVGWVVGTEVLVVVNRDKYKSGKHRAFGKDLYSNMAKKEGSKFTIQESFVFAMSHFNDSRYKFYTNPKRDLILGYEYQATNDSEDDWSSSFISSLKVI
jgi:hypothetical protein